MATKKTQLKAKAKSAVKRAVSKVKRGAKSAKTAAKGRGLPARAAPRKPMTRTKPTTPTNRPSNQKMTVDVYVATRVKAPWKAVMAELRMVIKTACPESVEAIKWGQPVYDIHGPCVWMRPATNHVSLGFWRGAELTDPDSLLEGKGDRMRHIKLADPEQVPIEKIDALIRQAAELNRLRGSPTVRTT